MSEPSSRLRPAALPHTALGPDDQAPQTAALPGPAGSMRQARRARRRRRPHRWGSPVCLEPLHADGGAHPAADPDAPAGPADPQLRLLAARLRSLQDLVHALDVDGCDGGNCAVPAVYDRGTGTWRHLTDLSRCCAARPSPAAPPPVDVPTGDLGVAGTLAGADRRDRRVPVVVRP